MKILVCGGRDYTNSVTLNAVLDTVQQLVAVTEIIQGGAKGADHLAKQWAAMRGIKCTEVLADWDTHGKKAGILRNIEMLELEPVIAVVFPGGRGTAHMCKIAEQAGIHIIRILA